MSLQTVPLSNVCEIIMGQAPVGSSYNENGEGLALIAGAGDFGQTTPEPKKYTTEASKISKFDDLILCIRATIGDLNWSDKEYCLGRGVAGLRPIAHMLDKNYLWHFIGANKNQLSAKGTGSTFKQVSRSHIAEWEIPLPPLTEQKRIAAILDKADAIRRKRQQAIQLADDFLRAVFLDMFGSSVDKREWKEVKFDEVALIDAKMVDPREAEYLDLLHIGPDRIEKNTGKLLPALTAREENLISKKFLFDQSYVLYSKIRPYLRKVALPDFVGLCSADMYPVRPKDGFLTREFLWQLLLSDDFTKYTETLPGRANIPKLNRNELNGYCFKLPPIDLQEKFSGIFRKQNQGYLSSRSAKEMSDSAFGALSQKAFSGQL